MEVQMAIPNKGAKSIGASTAPHRSSGDAKAVPNYLRPSTGSCHHVCKYGGTHTFEEKEAHKAQPRPRKQPPVPDNQNKILVKVRSVFRRRVGDSSRAEKAEKAAFRKQKEVESVEWKDIVAYDTAPAHGSSPQPHQTLAQITGSSDVKKKDAMKGKKSYDRAKITEQVKVSTEPHGANRAASPPRKNTSTDTKSVKPPKGKKPTALLVEKKAVDQEILHGYRTLSPSLIQSRASLLRDLEKEMAREATDVKEERTTYSLDQEEYAAAAAESSRPIPAHRRVKSMSISSRSVRFPFARQASKNSATFKLRSKSSKGPILPSEEEKPARLKSRRGAVTGEDHGSTGRGIQLRIRSLRRRGVGGSGGASTGFVVPAVALRHQKTLEKKRSQRLYNNLIEETASKLVKTRKSRVKALVGAFESVISKISK
ncbi:uncharacterized protein LOC133905438 [Phragmites australis]|uniref:uncharacterized protein LOC133905438 n=1 Tax=Phragmites australis TaxID=29695 RepID=UPI002D7A06CF|nr:uncharacterized protein LOC133905438 [Phragmites australis]